MQEIVISRGLTAAQNNELAVLSYLKIAAAEGATGLEMKRALNKISDVLVILDDLYKRGLVALDCTGSHYSIITPGQEKLAELIAIRDFS